MHEVGLMESALRMAIEHAKRARAARILRITLRVGRMSGVVPDALRFAFDVVTADTMAEGATLTIDEVSVSCSCETCGHAFEPRDHDFSCPQGRDHLTRITSGEQLELTTLEFC